ncbi:protein of unknown function [Pararobbsia alpina]
MPEASTPLPAPGGRFGHLSMTAAPIKCEAMTRSGAQHSTNRPFGHIAIRSGCALQ